MPFLPPWYRHSPWSGNLYRQAPDAFLWRFGFQRRDDASAKAEIGKAVEAAVMSALNGSVKEAEAADYAVHLFDQAMKGELSDEREDIVPITKRALVAMMSLGTPQTYQSTLRLEAGERFGLDHAVKVKTDFGYANLTVDMKVTWRLPSEPKFPHIAQLGTYNTLSDRSQALLYVTPKKSEFFILRPDQMAIGWQTMLSTWRRIDALDRMFDKPEDAVKLIALNTDTFYWPEKDRAEARKIWGLGEQETA